jgi:hypothetical protein
VQEEDAVKAEGKVTDVQGDSWERPCEARSRLQMQRQVERGKTCQVL